MDAVRNQRLSRFLEAPGRFAVHGTGAQAESVLAALAGHGLKPEALVDDDRSGALLGLAVVGPDEAVDLGLDAVVIAGPDPRERTVRLRADGFEGAVLDFSGVESRRWARLHDERLLAEHADAIDFARSLLQDDGSREIFDAVLAYRRSLDPGDLPPSAFGEGHPAVPVRDGEWILDVSAGDAAATDTILDLAEAVGPLGRVHALSASDERRDALRAAVETSALGARIVVHDGFPAKPEPGTDGNPSTLDELVWEETLGRVDRLRLDLAGARGLLAGASVILTELRPRVSVCLGHGPRDLFELPVLLKEQVPGYRLHLGQHGQAALSTFCYARPPGD
jgi:hypothetical protein